jgi:sugar phosphate isomerase/epimerase
MSFAICNELFAADPDPASPRWPLADQLRLVAEVGYDAVELAPFTLAPTVDALSVDRRREVARLVREHGLAVAGLHWLLVGPSGLHVNSPDPAVRARTVEYLEELIRACADLGGEVLVLGSPRQRWVSPDLSYEEATALALDTFAACAREAERRGVTFCLEPLPPPEANFMTTAAEVIGLVRQIGSPSLRMILDVKSMASEDRPMPELIREAAPYLAHFHANDANRRGPGFGAVDFRPIFAALAEVGYSGCISVEVFDYSPSPEVVARESLRYLREASAAVEK